MPKPNWTDTKAALNLTRGLDHLRYPLQGFDGFIDPVIYENGAHFEYEFLTEFNPLFGSLFSWASVLDDPDDFNPANPFDEAAFHYAFDLWSDLANVTFAEGGGDIEIGFGYPKRAVYSGSVFGMDSGIWFNDLLHMQSSDLFTSSWQEKSFTTFLHEIGHAIGLSHPGPYNGTANFDADALYHQDTDQYSLMSYFQEWENGSGVSYGFANDPNTPMLHDVLAVQSLYGVNWQTCATDTTYGFNASGDGMRDAFDFTVNKEPVVTIWDGGGTDTLDLSGFSSSQTIDLNPGRHSSVGNLKDNLAIAFGVKIENAVGGWGSDTIIGTIDRNRLAGGAGSDEIYGGNGADTLLGEDGNDVLVGGLGSDRLMGGAGNDILIGAHQLGDLPSAAIPQDVEFSAVEWVSDAFSGGRWASFNTRQTFFGQFDDNPLVDLVGLTRASDSPSNTAFTHLGLPDGDSIGFEPAKLSKFVGNRIQNHTPREIGDVNGDGYDDLVSFGRSGVAVGLSNGDGTFAPSIAALPNHFGQDQNWETQSRFPRKLGDVNGDGRDDIIGFHRSGVFVSLGNKDGTFGEPVKAHYDFRDGYGGWRDQFDTPRVIGDVNGDGRADIVAFRGTEVHVALGLADGTFGPRNIVSKDFGYEAANGNLVAFNNSDHFPRHLGDLNGDGYDDIVVFTHEPANRGLTTRLEDALFGNQRNVP